jgi:site-specific DNA recombinase
MSVRPVIRAAIYTRKSSEEGLEQGFNSLDAQHEACAAYITSQRHEGWKQVTTRFDDGGVSGGTLDRPALHRLMAEVDARRIDMIVVYKIDRLTRSLADFAKLVERLDKAGASFVSVTQSFNTSTSMGRLTLNVLLSFAQFEREVTAERIRDKIASSKMKGLWMGGTIPMGYDRHPDPQRRELVLNSGEAETVRHLFDLYDRLGSIGLVEAEAARLGLRSKLRDTVSGCRPGGGHFTKGQLHYLLTNPTYIGMVRHKERAYPGQHPAIITREVWDRVQAKLLSAKARPRRVEMGIGPALIEGAVDLPVAAFAFGSGSTPTAHKRTTGLSAPLLGKLFDETGDGLTPTRTATQGRSYRYYVSNRLIAGGTDPSGWRLPAVPLEQEIGRQIALHLRTAAERHRIQAEVDARTAVRIGDRALALSAYILREGASLLPDLVQRGEIRSGSLHLQLDATALAAKLLVDPDSLDPQVLHLSFGFSLRRRGIETRLVVGEREPEPDATLLRALADAHKEMAERRAGRQRADNEATSRSSGSRMRRRSYLAFLSPRIQQAILAGKVPEGLGLEKLLRMDLPVDWRAQEKYLGFDTLLR